MKNRIKTVKYFWIVLKCGHLVSTAGKGSWVKVISLSFSSFFAFLHKSFPV